MIKEAIEFIQTRVQDFEKPEFVKLPGDPPHVHHLRTGHEMRRVETAPPNRFIVLDRLSDLISMAVDPFDKDVKNQKRQAIFFDKNQVVLQFDTKTGREFAKVHLYPSDEYLFFRERVVDPLIGVDELFDALRYQLGATFDDPALIQQVSSLKLDTQGAKEHAAGRGSESMGEKINREAQSPAGLPNALQVFKVRRWRNAGLDFRFPIECILDPHRSDVRWKMVPKQDSIEEFDRKSLDQVEQMLLAEGKDAGIPLYQGQFLQPTQQEEPCE